MSIDEIVKVLPECFSYNEVLRKTGYTQSGSNAQTLKKLISLNRLDISHFDSHKRRIESSRRRGLPKARLLTKRPAGSPRVQGRELRKALLEVGREEICECGQLPMWNGAPLRLQVDHRDGNPLNNVETNLRFLCPNCHSQTDNFGSLNSKRVGENSHLKVCECGKPKTKSSKACKDCYTKSVYGIDRPQSEKIKWPSSDALVDMVKNMGYARAGQQLGVSGNAIKKRLKKTEQHVPGGRYHKP